MGTTCTSVDTQNMCMSTSVEDPIDQLGYDSDNDAWQCGYNSDNEEEYSPMHCDEAGVDDEDYSAMELGLILLLLLH